MKKIAIVGRPNVGKSTLFNRLIGKPMALVSDEPGVTRDWREGVGNLFELSFDVLDTAGLEDVRARGSLAERTAAHTKNALKDVDVIVMVMDARAGLTEQDKAVAREIRKVDKPIVVLANKCEGTKLPPGYDEAEGLGFGAAIAFSATHGEGAIDLYEAVKKYIAVDDEEFVPEEVAEGEEEKSLHIAVVGRPNAGKSTLINRLIGRDRMLTGPEPGLTRDAIPIAWEYKKRAVRLVDTAGMRKRARIDGHLEQMSVHESLRAIRLAHVVVLVLDADKALDKQDLTIAQHVVSEGRALVVVVNKWDIVKDKKAVTRLVEERLEDSLAQLSGVAVVKLSALTGDGVNQLMRAVMATYEVWNKRVSTSQLNRWLEKMEQDHPPPITSGRRIKLRYMTQIKSRPPTFSLWVNNMGLPESYQRFLTHGLRDTFGLAGVPIRWVLKKNDNPYIDTRDHTKAQGKKQGKKRSPKRAQTMDKRQGKKQGPRPGQKTIRGKVTRRPVKGRVKRR